MHDSDAGYQKLNEPMQLSNDVIATRENGVKLEKEACPR